LLVQSLASLENRPLGFEPAGRLVFSTQLAKSSAASSNPAVALTLQQTLLQRLRALPGVRAAAASSMLPLEGQGNLPAEDALAPNQSIGSVEVRMVSPGYFTAMGIPLVAGRDLSGSDTGAAPLVTVVNEALAHAWFRNRPVGGQIRIGMYHGKAYMPSAITATRSVVGVVGDVRTRSLVQPFQMAMYVPVAQLPMSVSMGSWFVVQGKVGAGPLRAAVAAVEPGARVSQMQPYSEVVTQLLGLPRFAAQLTAGFALLALLLTAVGLYGLLAYSVTERTREIGVRMALGAPRGRLLGQVAGRGMLLAVIGVGAGVGFSLPLGKLIASVVFGVRTDDPATLAGAALALLVIAFIACLGPALRATRVDAASALRAE
ncbi:MAG: FtsX-like permease family protein, partial [Terriglobales bacterium]